MQISRMAGNNMRPLAIAAATLLLTSSCAPPEKGDHWHQIGQLTGSGRDIRFVEIDANNAHNGAVYRDAASTLCGTDGSGCYQVAFYLPGDKVPPSEDRATFFGAGGYTDYPSVATYTGGQFTQWDCEKAGVTDAPLSALCGTGVKEQYEAIGRLVTRVSWTIACGLPANNDSDLVAHFIAHMKDKDRAAQFQQLFDQNNDSKGPDDPADCQNLREKIESHARDARKTLLQAN